MEALCFIPTSIEGEMNRETFFCRKKRRKTLSTKKNNRTRKIARKTFELQSEEKSFNWGDVD
jgi:hypothetical protein